VASRGGLENLVSYGREILRGVSTRAEIHQKLAAVFGNDEGANVVVVMQLVVVARLGGEAVILAFSLRRWRFTAFLIKDLHLASSSAGNAEPAFSSVLTSLFMTSWYKVSQ
jgi:hypothetical protein